MKPARTLFLDFDGVLHPNFPLPDGRFCCAARLAECLDGSDVQVVVSSSWRFEYSLPQIRQQIPPALARRVVGVTGDAIEGPHQRWNEIRQYLLGHGIDDWRALDDSAYEFPPGCKELILCKGSTGLGNAQLNAVRRWAHASTDGTSTRGTRPLSSTYGG